MFTARVQEGGEKYQKHTNQKKINKLKNWVELILDLQIPLIKNE